MEPPYSFLDLVHCVCSSSRTSAAPSLGTAVFVEEYSLDPEGVTVIATTLSC